MVMSLIVNCGILPGILCRISTRDVKSFGPLQLDCGSGYHRQEHPTVRFREYLLGRPKIA